MNASKAVVATAPATVQIRETCALTFPTWPDDGQFGGELGASRNGARGPLSDV